MGVAFILGAGASFGESLTPLPPPPGAPPPNTALPPLQTGFFARSLYQSIGYSLDEADRDYAEVFAYIRNKWLMREPPDEKLFETLSIEDVFTSIEIDREFHGPESDQGAFLTLARNKLVRYIQRIIGFCTEYKSAEYTKRLVSALEINDTVLTFNWDLLADQALLDPSSRSASLYTNFLILVHGREPVTIKGIGTIGAIIGPPGREPLFLKLHGSLNWFQCTNSRCPNNADFELETNIQGCLYAVEGIGVRYCDRCGSEMIPLLVPPIAQKPISDNRIIRSAWGFARQRLATARKVVVIGLSFAPTDFYARWLFRFTVGVRDNVEVFVVNPSNGDREFRDRMDGIFIRGYNCDFHRLDQLDAILDRVEREPKPPAS